MTVRAVLCAGAMLCAPFLVAAQSPLDRPVTFAIRDAPLSEALLRLKRELNLPLAWRGDLLPPLTRVTVNATQEPLRDVLAQVLRQTLLIPRVTRGGTVVLMTGDAVTDRDAMATGVHSLDQLLVTGSAVTPSAQREQPTTISVVTRRDIAASPHRRLSDAMRAFLPGVVLWDHGGVGPPAAIAGGRGVASFTSRAPKVYVDGVEVASADLFTLLDLRGVERIEMIPGPQGAALYGPEAIAGVIQLETRKGAIADAAVRPEADALAGGFSREVDGTALWREGGAAVDIDGSVAAAHALASWSRIGTDDRLTEVRRAQAGGKLRTGAVQAEWSARIAAHDAALERITPNGNLAVARGTQPLEERGLGVRMVHAASGTFSHAVTAGAHRITGSREPFRSPILAPTLPLGATNETATRSSVRWAGTFERPHLTMTLGAELSRRNLSRSARQSGGGADLSALYDEALDSRGGFAQLRLRHGGLVLSGGLRSDRISSLGTEAGTPWAATAGVSWSAPLGLNTVQLRAAWGRALRPPEPGMSIALASGSIAQQSNADLSPESQAGYEVGAEWHSPQGAWLRITWFDQRAEALIQQVDLRRTVDARRLYQFQNVGAITNRGIELDGGLEWRYVSLAGRLNIVRSRVARLSSAYTGDFTEGDPPLEVPASMASVALRHDRGLLRTEIGATWVGPWTGYDWRLIQRVEAGQTPVADRSREYWLGYDGVLRPFLGASLQVAPDLALMARLEWPTSSNAFLRDNLTPEVGRTLVVGVQFNQ